MVIKRLFSKAVVLGLGLASLAWFSLAGAAEEIPAGLDLASDAAMAQARQVPLLILFTAPKCPYCERVKQEFLHPGGVDVDGGHAPAAVEGGLIEREDLDLVEEGHGGAARDDAGAERDALVEEGDDS